MILLSFQAKLIKQLYTIILLKQLNRYLKHKKVLAEMLVPRIIHIQILIFAPLCIKSSTNVYM